MNGDVLVVDLGSTRVAWRGLRGEGSAAHEGDPGAVLARAFGGGPPASAVVVGSVAEPAAAESLRRTCEGRWGVPVRELVAASESLGVRNGYRNPAQLGIDRWAAVVAARVAHDGAVLVADCGTAVTIDYVDTAGRHRGGVIGPGIGLMRSMLGTGTRLRLGATLGTGAGTLGRDTEEAVAIGTAAGVAGLLESTRREVAAAFGAPETLLITGGEAQAVRARLDGNWSHAPGLVLDGLALLAAEVA